MPKLDIIKLPDPILRQVSKPIAKVDAGVRRLIDDMLETMYAAPGVGLAAVQVGRPLRLLVIDIGDDDDDDDDPKRPIAMVNPEIVSLGPVLKSHEEGCLSIPDVRFEIERPSSLVVRYVDRDGKSRELAADGLLATAIQHEIDHLNGRMIIDYMSRLKRDIIIRRFKKQARTD